MDLDCIYICSCVYIYLYIHSNNKEEKVIKLIGNEKNTGGVGSSRGRGGDGVPMRAHE